MANKKISEMTEVVELGVNHFIPVVDQTAAPFLNQKISKANLIAEVGGIDDSHWLQRLILIGDVDPVGGTIGSVSANSYFRYKIIGKTMFFQFHLTCSFTGAEDSVVEIRVNLSDIFLTNADANGGYWGVAIDNASGETGSFRVLILNNSGMIKLQRALPAANFTTPGTYEISGNGVMNIQ